MTQAAITEAAYANLLNNSTIVHQAKQPSVKFRNHSFALNSAQDGDPELNEHVIKDYFDRDSQRNEIYGGNRQRILKMKRTQSIAVEEEFDGRHRPKLSESELMHRMLSIVKRYDITVQKLNRLRFESLREDRKGSGTIPAHFFKSM